MDDRSGHAGCRVRRRFLDRLARDTTGDKPLMRYSIDLGPDAVAGENVTAVVFARRKPPRLSRARPKRHHSARDRLISQAARLSSGARRAQFSPFFSPDARRLLRQFH